MLLEISGLHAHYGRINAIDDVSLSLDREEIVVVIGANGGGKSTLLKAIVGLVTPSSGSIKYDGKDITAQKPHDLIAEGLCLIPEGRQVVPDLTVQENLTLGAYRRIRSHKKKEVEKDIKKYFDLFPVLGQRREQMAGTLSGGEQQMLAVARGLMSRPKVLLIDEMSLGLAPKVVQSLFKTLKQLNQEGLTVLLVEQMAWMALRICHRGYVLEGGRITLQGTREELLSNPKVIEAYVGKKS
jgi:branched-chain amino acid transport system ATP-binding protein